MTWYQKLGNYIIQRIKKDIESRKFQITIAGTILLCFGKIQDYQWLILAGWYIGINIAQDWIVRKNGGNGDVIG